MLKDFLNRLNSIPTILALLALVYFVVKTWVGFEIPEWATFVELLAAVLTAVGVFNDPTNKTGF
jgi:uncharacterized membrane protein